MIARRLFLTIFWSVTILISIYFYYDSVIDYFFGYRNERFGLTLFENQIWFVAHMMGATFSLFLGPFQFLEYLRKKYVRFHRVAGKFYIIGSLVAGVSALRLALIFDCIGCRYSLLLLSILFLLTTSLAWLAIKRKNIIAHKQFMIRSYTCAMAFVFVRLNQLLPLDFLYSSINDEMLKRTVNEWLFSLLPIIIVEVVMIWIPTVSQSKLRQ
jgi:uncharacterized membrane protein